MKPSIVSIDRALSPDDFREVSQFALDAGYFYGEQDDDDHKPTGLVSDLDLDDEEDDDIFCIFERVIYARFPEIKEYMLQNLVTIFILTVEKGRVIVKCHKNFHQKT